MSKLGSIWLNTQGTNRQVPNNGQVIENDSWFTKRSIEELQAEGKPSQEERQDQQKKMEQTGHGHWFRRS